MTFYPKPNPKWKYDLWSYYYKASANFPARYRVKKIKLVIIKAFDVVSTSWLDDTLFRLRNLHTIRSLTVASRDLTNVPPPQHEGCYCPTPCDIAKWCSNTPEAFINLCTPYLAGKLAEAF